MQQTYALKIKNVCDSFLRELHIPFQIPKTDADAAFLADCQRVAEERGVGFDGDDNLARRLTIGCELIKLAYPNLNREQQIFSIVFSAVICGIDDACKKEIEFMENFSYQFVNGNKHGHPILDTYDSMLRELPELFGSFLAGMMLHSALEFLVGLRLEYEVLQIPVVATRTEKFPGFLRDMSAISRFYVVLIFSQGIPLRSWMQAIPACMDYFQYANDILSFYKEELIDESDNYISIRALSSGKSKLEVLQYLVDEVVKSYKETLQVLSQSPEALEAYKGFCQGYVYLHMVCKRYKFVELWMCDQNDV